MTLLGKGELMQCLVQKVQVAIYTWTLTTEISVGAVLCYHSLIFPKLTAGLTLIRNFSPFLISNRSSNLCQLNCRVFQKNRLSKALSSTGEVWIIGHFYWKINLWSNRHRIAEIFLRQLSTMLYSPQTKCPSKKKRLLHSVQYSESWYATNYAWQILERSKAYRKKRVCVLWRGRRVPAHSI